jgi:predicted Zn-dependent peptidase
MKVKLIINYIVLTISFFLYSPETIGSQYTPKGLYDPEYLTLKNGLDVVLKKRDITHNVSIRIAVNVGQIDFPCGRKEQPHFLEHLLFTGTSQHSEVELDDFIEENGGLWNASTENEKTIYEVDIYSPNSLFALDLLYEIFTDSQISAENVELSRDIIHRESGGKPSVLRQWLYRHGIGRNAYTNTFLEMFPGSNVICPSLQTAEGITRDDIIDTFKQYYIPNNMQLVIVGEFDRDKIIDKIHNTFGLLKSKLIERKYRKLPSYYKAGPSEISGLFSPIVESEAFVGLVYRTNGDISPDIHPLEVIENYLDTGLYNSLRVETGLSYSPDSGQINWDKYGLFSLGADVDLDKLDIAVKYLKNEVDYLRYGAFTPADIMKSKRKILLSWVQGFESNSDIADYYVSKHHELKLHGALIDHEDGIEHVSMDDIKRVSSRYFVDDNSVTIKDAPTLSYTQFYVLTGFILIIGVYILWHVIHRLRHRKNK